AAVDIAGAAEPVLREPLVQDELESVVLPLRLRRLEWRGSSRDGRNRGDAFTGVRVLIHLIAVHERAEIFDGADQAVVNPGRGEDHLMPELVFPAKIGPILAHRLDVRID